MPQPLGVGTRVAISLEVTGQTHPLAQGEVRWCRMNPSGLEGRFQGCGIRFTDYLNPRAAELITYLVESLETGRPLKVAPRRLRRWPQVLLLTASAASSAALLVLVLSQDAPSFLPTPLFFEGPPLLAPLPSVGDAPSEGAGTPFDSQAASSTPKAQWVDHAATEVEVAALRDATAGHVDNETLSPVDKGFREALPGASEPLPVSNPVHSSESVAEGQLLLPTGAAKALTWHSSADGLDVRPELQADARVVRVFSLSDPPRLVFDIEGSAPSKSHALAASSVLITRVRIGQQGALTRVVLDLASQPQRVTAASDHALVQF
jgi:hypothetical protein